MEDLKGEGVLKSVGGGEKLGNRERRVGDFRLLKLQQHFVLCLHYIYNL